MSLKAPDPQPWYMAWYAIKVHLSHLVSLIGPHYGRSWCPQHAGTQVRRQVRRMNDKSRGRLDQLTLICPKRLRILPDRLPCRSSLSLSIKGLSYHTRSLLAR